jgi:hypothetical protein
MDMEVPYFDEDDTSHEKSYIEAMRQQRAIFERQQEQRQALRKIAIQTGSLVYGRFVQSEQAKKWVDRMAKVIKPTEVPQVATSEQEESHPSRFGSSIAAEMNNSNRSQIKIQTKVMLKKKKGFKMASISLD